MRPIKYKVYLKELKEIVTVDIISFIDREITVVDEFGNDYNFHFNEIEFMQYTGLKDKNGTEIYEGDVLKGEFLIDQHIHDCIGLLVFKNYGFLVEVPGFGDEDFIDWKDAETLEVIGNIYEDRHLLEVQT